VFPVDEVIGRERQFVQLSPPRSGATIKNLATTTMDHATYWAVDLAAYELDPVTSSFFAFAADDAVDPWIFFQNPLRAGRWTWTAEQKDCIRTRPVQASGSIDDCRKHIDEAGDSYYLVMAGEEFCKDFAGKAMRILPQLKVAEVDLDVHLLKRSCNVKRPDWRFYSAIFAHGRAAHRDSLDFVYRPALPERRTSYLNRLHLVLVMAHDQLLDAALLKILATREPNTPR